ncbi:hypothetical protein [Nocardia sp. NBC_00511]|uniref:hypothetical protein n=1 Tax=Nocardia sp. NBC_00511 TaxID=2903591 RepID=UPI0030DEE578
MSTVVIKKGTEKDTIATQSEIQESVPDAMQSPSLAIKLSTLITGLTITGLVAVACLFAGLYFSADGKLSERDARVADADHAEQTALDYAVGASTIDYRNAKAWFDTLAANTTPQLAAKFAATAPQLEQLLLPLQWTSKAVPISAAVTSESNGIYKVNAFLTVTSTSAQTPAGTQTTVTYALTVDKNSGWKITDVGGLDGALPGK